MSFGADVLQLLLFLLQQLGVLVGVGAQSIILVAHLRELHVPTFHEREERWYTGARRARLLALGFIILSGAVITLETLAVGAYDIFFAPAFIAKWALIIAALALVLFLKSQSRWRWALEGASGAVWYAVLILHIAAPQSAWNILLLWGGLWLVAFYALWAGAGALLKGTSTMPHFSLPTMPKFSVPKISLPKIALPKKAAPVEPAPAPEPVPVMMKVQEYIENGLPHIRIMPRTPEEAQRHFA